MTGWHERGYKHVFRDNQHRREHSIIMENHIGRKLYPWEIIHHINGVRNDNRLQNLFLTNRTIHSSVIHTYRRIDGVQCPRCNSKMTIRSGYDRGIQRWHCNSCNRRFQAEYPRNKGWIKR